MHSKIWNVFFSARLVLCFRELESILFSLDTSNRWLQYVTHLPSPDPNILKRYTKPRSLFYEDFVNNIRSRCALCGWLSQPSVVADVAMRCDISMSCQLWQINIAGTLYNTSATAFLFHSSFFFSFTNGNRSKVINRGGPLVPLKISKHHVDIDMRVTWCTFNLSVVE